MIGVVLYIASCPLQRPIDPLLIRIHFDPIIVGDHELDRDPSDIRYIRPGIGTIVEIVAYNKLFIPVGREIAPALETAFDQRAKADF